MTVNSATAWERLRAVLGELRRAIPSVYVGVVLWAASTVLLQSVSVGPIARIALAAAMAIAVYALLVAFVIFVACGRWGIVRAPHRRRLATTLAVTACFVWVFADAWHHGRSGLNLVAIAAAELAGLALYLGRASVLESARLRITFGRP